MRSETQPYSTVIAIRLCRTAHAIFSPKFWNYKTNFTRVFVTVSPRRPWDRGCSQRSAESRGFSSGTLVSFHKKKLVTPSVYAVNDSRD